MALNRVKGIISQFGEIQQGTSQNGFDWARQVVILDVASFNNTFSKIALTAQNQRVDDLASYQIGDRVEVSYSVTAGEYNGKWYNSVDLVSISLLDDSASAPAPSQTPQVAPAPRQEAAPQARVQRPVTTPQVPQGADLEPQGDDLPF